MAALVPHVRAEPARGEGLPSPEVLRRLRADEAAGAGHVFAPGEAMVLLRRLMAKRKRKRGAGVRKAIRF